jgi:hypothetical protein
MTAGARIAGEEDQQALPPHRVSVAGGWSLWRTFLVRSAGFPANMVLSLASPAVCDLADRILELEAARDERRRPLRMALKRNEVGAKPDALSQALQALDSGAVPEWTDASSEVGTLMKSYVGAVQVLTAAHEQFVGVWAEESSRLHQVLRSIASEPRFREAVTWQNRNALKTGLDAFLRTSPERLEKGRYKDRDRARQHAGLVARYVQRYCTKNDTIGFFGPVGWGRFDPDGPPAAVRIGAGLLARRTLYFEYWAIDALATKLAADPAVRPWLAPRRMPTLRVEGTTVWSGTGRTREVPPAVARLLAACDGERSAREIAQGLIRDPTLGLQSDEEVYTILGELVDRGMVLWTLEVPTCIWDPEVKLRRELERVGDEPLRHRCLSVLDNLEAKKSAVARAAGDPEALDKAIEELESTFHDLTRLDPTRRAGEMYAARTLVHEDCVRDLDLTLGRAVLDRLGPPLELILQSARWFTAEVAARCERVFLDVYEELATQTGSPVVDFLSFWWRTTTHVGIDIHGPAPSIVVPVVRELQDRWSRILAYSPDERLVSRSVESIRASVLDAFAATEPGWPQARFHGPDLLLAAPGVDAIAKGNYLWVLGEMHPAFQSMNVVTFAAQHPNPQDLSRALEADVPESCVTFAVPKENQMRSQPWPRERLDFEVELGKARSPRSREQVLAAADLVVDRVANRLRIRSRDGRRCFDWQSFDGSRLSDAVGQHFRLIAHGKHSPRVQIDGMVIGRETWTLPGNEISTASKERADRFVAIRRWRRKHRMPRFVYVKAPNEVKPIYVDFDSPIYAAEVMRLVRESPEITVSEMLPSFDELWLADKQGNRYTSELRFAAVDLYRWRAR